MLNILPILSAFTLTLLAHIIAKRINKFFNILPMVVTAMIIILFLLFIFHWQYELYYSTSKPIFDHLLGYVVVLLAVPIASMDFSGLPLKKLSGIVLIGTLIGALLPMAMAYAFSLSHETILSFATRSVTTPVGLSIGRIVNAPLAMVNLIIIIAGILGGTFARLLFRNVHDDRAKGLVMGLMAHAFGTVEAWQISHIAGRYAAFGLAINGLITAIWLPIFLQLFV